MEWFAISMVVIFLTGLGIVTGTAIRNAYKDQDWLEVGIPCTADGMAWAVIGKTLYIGKDRATGWSPF